VYVLHACMCVCACVSLCVWQNPVIPSHGARWAMALPANITGAQCFVLCGVSFCLTCQYPHKEHCVYTIVILQGYSV